VGVGPASTRAEVVALVAFSKTFHTPDLGARKTSFLLEVEGSEKITWRRLIVLYDFSRSAILELLFAHP
jgi:hypothetical protein